MRIRAGAFKQSTVLPLTDSLRMAVWISLHLNSSGGEGGESSNWAHCVIQRSICKSKAQQSSWVPEPMRFHRPTPPEMPLGWPQRLCSTPSHPHGNAALRQGEQDWRTQENEAIASCCGLPMDSNSTGSVFPKINPGLAVSERRNLDLRKSDLGDCELLCLWLPVSSLIQSQKEATQGGFFEMLIFWSLQYPNKAETRRWSPQDPNFHSPLPPLLSLRRDKRTD